jgi:hypothetical protein
MYGEKAKEYFEAQSVADLKKVISQYEKAFSKEASAGVAQEYKERIEGLKVLVAKKEKEFFNDHFKIVVVS